MSASSTRSLFRQLQRAAAALLVTATTACFGNDAVNTGAPSNPAVDVYAASLGVKIATMTKKNDNLYDQDLVVGTGAEAVTGRTLQMVYTGWLVNASKFDSNVGGNLFSFRLGLGEVIPGWDQGILGMKVGGKRRIVIGSSLAYGSGGQGPIPPNATLVFDVELKAVQ